MKLTMTLLLILTLLTFLFTQLTHPLSMGLTLMINTTITALTINIFSESPWFSYMLFLIFLGGMLVLFTYVTSLASNEMFNINTKMMTLLLIIPASIILIMILDPLLITTPSSLQDTLQASIEQQEIPLMKLYNKSMATITLTLATYLFITLVAVVKVTNLQQGPLRPHKPYVNTHAKTTSPNQDC